MDQILATKKETYLGYAWISKSYLSDQPISYSSSCGSLKMCVNQPNMYISASFHPALLISTPKMQRSLIIVMTLFAPCLEIMPKFVHWHKKMTRILFKQLDQMHNVLHTVLSISRIGFSKAKRLTWQLISTIEKVWSKFKNAASVIKDLNPLFLFM